MKLYDVAEPDFETDASDANSSTPLLGPSHNSRVHGSRSRNFLVWFKNFVFGASILSTLVWMSYSFMHPIVVNNNNNPLNPLLDEFVLRGNDVPMESSAGSNIRPSPFHRHYMIWLLLVSLMILWA